MIRIVIADDHRLVREGIVGLLRMASDIEVVGQASDGEEALASSRRRSRTWRSSTCACPRSPASSRGARARDKLATKIVLLTTFDDDARAESGHRRRRRRVPPQRRLARRAHGCDPTSRRPASASGRSSPTRSARRSIASALDFDAAEVARAAHAARTRGAASHRGRHEQPRDRRRARRRGRHGEKPHVEHPPEARRSRSHARGPQGDSARPICKKRSDHDFRHGSVRALQRSVRAMKTLRITVALLLLVFVRSMRWANSMTSREMQACACPRRAATRAGDHSRSSQRRGGSRARDRPPRARRGE